jgi:catechol 2,3-dioxygenase-like lactoylglutathione lyase family enzyme
MVTVDRLHSVVVGTPDPGALVAFYETVWGLRRIAQEGRTVYLRGAGPEPYLVAVAEAPQPVLLSYRLGLGDRASVDAAYEELSRRPGVIVRSKPEDVDGPGGGYGFAVADVDGRTVELCAGLDVLDHKETDGGISPTKLSHLVVNSADADAFARFCIDGLGFTLADEMPHMLFLRCNADHHSLAVARAPHLSLNHVAFELPSVETMLDGARHMTAEGFRILWGPGRHGPGNNTFAYFAAPNGQVIEYTAEVQQIPAGEAPSPRMWLPEDLKLSDAWAAPDSLRPLPGTRELMLGAPEPVPGPPTVVDEWTPTSAAARDADGGGEQR